MDVKTFKSDLTYAIKKLTKEGKTFVVDVFPDNLQRTTVVTVDERLTRCVEDGQFVLGDKFDALEAFVFVKGLEYTSQKYVEDWIDPQGEKHHSEWLYHEAFGVPLTDIVSLKAEITKVDLYSFMDGLENVEVSNPKDPWYGVGVYIREKFAPVGARTEPLRKTEFQIERSGFVAKKWIVHNRPMPGCKRGGPPAIIEVECEMLTPAEDPSINFLPQGQFKGRVFKPEFLHEEVRVLKDGLLKDVVMPAVYYSHSLYYTEHQAMAHATAQVRSSLEFEVRKGKRTSFTEEDVQEQVKQIQIVRLPV